MKLSEALAVLERTKTAEQAVAVLYLQQALATACEVLEGVNPKCLRDISGSTMQTSERAFLILNDLDTPAPAEPSDPWSADPPDSPGLWWLYGDEEFGAMGGNYTGDIPPEARLQVVDIRLLGNALTGVSRGRFVSLTPFDPAQRRPGYVGKWRKVDLPPLPDNIPTVTFPEAPL